MDWVHCNHCFLLPDPGKCFFLTSCGHIFCSDCKEHCAHGVCKLCETRCTTTPLSSSMKPDVQKYFTDPCELLKKNLKEIQQISEFQRGHRTKLTAYYRKQHIKFRQMKDEFRKILKNMKNLENERKHLSKENDSLKKFIDMHGISRPLATINFNSATSPTAALSEKSHGLSPYVVSPPHSAGPGFSKLFNKLGSCNSRIPTSHRVSVFTPPVNGRIGGIPQTPSSAFMKLSLSSAQPNEFLQRCQEQRFSPSSSQGTECSTFVTPGQSITLSPADTVRFCNEQSKGLLNKRDAKKVVVHPYSPYE